MTETAASLVVKRGSVKASITRTEKYIDDVRDDVTINNLKDRLKHLGELYLKYDEIQLNLEVLDTNEYGGDRESIENRYLNLKSKINDLIEQKSVQLRLDNNVKERSSLGLDGTHVILNENYSGLPKISLPEFNGDYDKWQNFKDLFINLVHERTNISNIRKLYYLKSALRGEASRLIECLHASEENYEKAWETLTKRYDNKAILLKTHLKGIFELPRVERKSHTSFRLLLSKFGQHYNSLKALGVPVEHWDAILVHILSEKLDNFIIQAYEDRREKTDFPNLEKFLEFLEQRCSTLELISRDNNSIKRISTNTSQVKNVKCSFCNNESHAIIKCNKFAATAVTQRRTFARDKKLCFKCLKGNHFSEKCFSKEVCRICRQKHHTLLHPADVEKPTVIAAAAVETDRGSKENSSNTATISDTCPTDVCTSSVNISDLNFDIKDDKGVILWPIAIVLIIDKLGNKHKCRALLDSASEKNYITQEYATKLNVDILSCEWQVSGVSGVATQVKRSVDLIVESRVSNYKFSANFGILRDITGHSPKREIDLKTVKWPRHITLADPTFNKVNKIDMLLGTEVFAKTLREGTIDLGQDQPVLQNTEFGWVFHGAVRVNVLATQVNQTLVSSVSTLNDTMSKFWGVEQLPNKRVLTDEEQSCENKFKESVARDDTGRYSVDLPVIENKLHLLGESYDQAYRCLLALERRFAKNPKLFENYKAFIDEYLSLGHAKIVNLKHENNKGENKSFYMPHHAVLKETSSTTKLRVVFNASAPSDSGVSLNDLLLVGAVVQPDLVTILLRYRTYKYAITADMTKMYRQVRVNSNYQALQRILWRDAPDKPIQCLQLTTVTYGTASASFLATRTLLQLVSDEGDEFPLASSALKNNSYIDDIITGANNIDSAQKLQSELIELLARGGFELHKWCSNEPSLLSNIPVEKREIKNVSLTNDKDSVRTLGIIWNPNSDSFEIAISDDIVNDVKYTKRSVLSCIAKIFDPLGFTGPITARAKIIMQDIWRENLNWDDQIPSHIMKNWLPFKDQLLSLREVSIPRLMVIDNTVNIQLHGFSDSSMKAYGAVVYLRSEDEKGNVIIRLIASKSHVAPLKVISLPRLELCGALLLTRLINQIKTALNLNESLTYLWTDSTIVLAWIASESSRWNVFVANRVSEIQSLTSSDNWGHVASENNPADLVSRGLEPRLLKDCSLWWQGPSWLNLKHSDWPNNLEQNSVISELPEERKSSRTCATVIESNYFYDVFSKYSSFNRLQRIMAYVLRFVYNVRNVKENRRVEFLSANELCDSLKFIVKTVQEKHFSTEIELLRKLNDAELKDKHLRLLNPFLDEDGLFRVRGRLKYCPVKSNQRHPYILPEKSHVTKILIIYEHERLFHASMQLLLANLRLKFWIINARSAIQKAINKCIKCFKFSANSANQIMADLPRVRVTPARPFLHTGVDYAGPISVRQSRIRKSIITKGYICLFVCMTTKSIHLELVSDMTTKSFLNALFRFMSRRGKCAKIFSDNGLNFKGARQELHGLYKLFHSKSSTEQIHNYMSNEGIEWNFIPPLSPHWGGIWEAGVKSVKHHLRRMVGLSTLTYEELYTVIVQIEGILNSRPLCPLNSNPDDFDYLSPSHFLIGDVLTACPEIDVSNVSVNRLNVWQQISQIKQVFWKRWSSEYLSELQQRKKWYKRKIDIDVNDLVLVKEDNVPPLSWCLARVIETHKGKDGHVRSVSIKTKNGTYVRPITKIAPLPINKF